ncbi:MAG: DUF533 domain-containing protein [Pseudomonadota bacterium]
MRFVLSALALVGLLLPQQADARGIPIYYGTEQQMEFVTNTEIASSGSKPLALCHLYETNTLYSLGYWMRSNGYVLSDSSCDGQSYIDDPALIQASFANGAIPAGIPTSPGFSILQRAEGHAALGIGALIVLVVLVVRMGRSGMPRRKSRMEERMEVLGLPEGAMFRFIDAMLHAANADGKAQPEEVEFIRAKATEVTQLDYTAEHIEWAVNHTDKLRSPRDFQRFGRGLTPEQARMVLRAALAVVAADGQMSRSERRFISQLTAGLMLDPQDVQRILGDRPGGMQPATA